MNGRVLAQIMLRVLAVWLLAHALIAAANVPYFFDPQWEQVRRLSIAFALLPAVVGIVLGTLLWMHAERLAAIAAPAVPAPGLVLPAEGLVAAALPVLGIMLVSEAVPLLVNALTLFAMSRRSWATLLGPQTYTEDQRALIWSVHAQAGAVSAGVRLLIGIGLVLGPRRLASALAAVRREVGTSQLDEDPPPNPPPTP